LQDKCFQSVYNQYEQKRFTIYSISSVRVRVRACVRACTRVCVCVYKL